MYIKKIKRPGKTFLNPTNIKTFGPLTAQENKISKKPFLSTISPLDLNQFVFFPFIFGGVMFFDEFKRGIEI